MTALLVALGGMAGALLRFGLDTAFTARSQPGRARFPYATLVVNAAGSFLIGVLFEALKHGDIGTAAYEAGAAGLAGGLTTFSSWSTATIVLWQDGRRWAAGANVGLNLILSVAAVFLGRLAAG